MNYAHVGLVRNIRTAVEKTHKIRKIEEFINYLNSLKFKKCNPKFNWMHFFEFQKK